MFVSCLANGCVTSAVVAAAAVLKAPGDRGVNCTFGGMLFRVWPRKEGPEGKGAGDGTSSGALKQTLHLSLTFMAPLTAVHRKIRISSYLIVTLGARRKDKNR